MKIDIANRQLYYINMKNQTKKTEEKVYTAGEVGSMLESIDNTVKIISENYLSVVDTQDKILKVQDKILEVQYDMNDRLGRVEVRLDSVETKIDRLQDDMVEVKFELKKKVAVDDFEKLEKRVVKLEKLSYSH